MAVVFPPPPRVRRAADHEVRGRPTFGKLSKSQSFRANVSPSGQHRSRQDVSLGKDEMFFAHGSAFGWGIPPLWLLALSSPCSTSPSFTEQSNRELRQFCCSVIREVS